MGAATRTQAERVLIGSDGASGLVGQLLAQFLSASGGSLHAPADGSPNAALDDPLADGLAAAGVSPVSASPGATEFNLLPDASYRKMLAYAEIRALQTVSAMPGVDSLRRWDDYQEQASSATVLALLKQRIDYAKATYGLPAYSLRPLTGGVIRVIRRQESPEY